jgi:hypothetical protein
MLGWTAGCTWSLAKAYAHHHVAGHRSQQYKLSYAHHVVGHRDHLPGGPGAGSPAVLPWHPAASSWSRGRCSTPASKGGGQQETGRLVFVSNSNSLNLQHGDRSSGWRYVIARE